ncbi:MAG: T9SS type A sorting domain-containing protein, partial [Bacteroidetes bacterium]|nr:T9SS type A sorting domain-containing protein [Bacteroidota bacterium]
FSDLIEDFSIGSSFKSKSDGFSIGALHWTSEIDNFDSETSLNAIKEAYDTPTAIDDVKELSPADNSVFNTYPNPFMSQVQVEFSVDKNSHVRVAVYNSIGRLVKILVDEKRNTGIHKITWNADNMPAGIYYCSFMSEGKIKTSKMILTK